MQSTTQFNSAVAPSTACAEQRDDSEHSSCFHSREQPTNHECSTHAPSYSLESITQTSNSEHWSKHLRRSVSSPTYDEYTCENDELNTCPNNAATAQSSVMNKLMSTIPIPKLFGQLNTELINGDHSASTTYAQRKQILMMLQSKSQDVARETSKSLSVLMEKAEAGRHILTERAEVSKFTDKLSQFQDRMQGSFCTKGNGSEDCYRNAGTKQHVREVSFDYQLMNDVEYSSAPAKFLSRCE